MFVLPFIFLLVQSLITPKVSQASDLISAQEVAQKALALKMDQTRAWHKLLHFEPTMLGPSESQIDSSNFFLSPDGKTNPQAELVATIEQIWKTWNLSEEEAIQCRFPARYLFLKDMLSSQIKIWPDRECPRLFKYFTALRGVSVSLIFSSYYINNPSSAFGHTLLRINKAASENGKRFELLDYGLNYAANANSYNAVTYAFKGLFGGFPGTFTSVPYYYKVREYNNAESRDLWEYELNIPAQNVDRLIYHIWEMGPTAIDYWYLTENCSYFMLTLLEAADPSLDLTSPLKKYVIPSDTVHVVAQIPGLVKSVKYRPSIRSELYARLQNLSSGEVDYVEKILHEQKIPETFKTLSTESQAHILDCVLDGIDHKFIHEIQHESPEKKFKDEILLQRSQIPFTSPILIVPTPTLETPDQGHPTRRIDISTDSDRFFFKHKFAHHELLDPIVGYPEYSQITFFDSEFGYDRNKSKAFFEKLTLFEVLSLSPWDRFFKPFSWRLNVGFQRMYSLNSPESHFATASGGAGLSWQWSAEPKLTTYLGFKTSIDEPIATNETQTQLGYGPNLIARLRIQPNWIFLSDFFWRFETKGPYRYSPYFSVATQWTSKKFYGVELSYVQNPSWSQGRIGFVGYY